MREVVVNCCGGQTLRRCVVVGLVAVGGLLGVGLVTVAAGSRVGGAGALDPSFGRGGKAIVDFGVTDYFSELVLQPDGKIVLAGSVSKPSGSDFAVARLNPDGRLDASFGARGKRMIDLGGKDAATATLLLPDAKIVLVGWSGADLAVARLTPDGRLDASFGSGGKAMLDLGGDVTALAAALQADGKIVAAGRADKKQPLGVDVAVARINADGTLDSSFGEGGKTTVGVSALAGSGLALQPDGGIILAGDLVKAAKRSVTNPSGLHSDVALARLTSNGKLDPSFGTRGTATIDFGGDDIPGAVALQPDGKIVVAGHRSTYVARTYRSGFAIARIRPNGTLDSSFGRDGKTTVAFRAGSGPLTGLIGAGAKASAVAIQPDGKSVAAGANGAEFFTRTDVKEIYDFAVVRLLGTANSP